MTTTATHTAAIPFQWSGNSLSSLIPSIKSWRPYQRKDRDAVVKLRRPCTETLFGVFNMDEMIELSNHRIVMVNTNDQIIACLCLRNYPNIPALLPEVWTEVIWRQYLLSELNHENTLFVHMLLWDRRYDWELLSYLLKSMFLSLFRLQFVVLTILPSSEHAAMLSNHLMGKYFIQVRPTTVVKNSPAQTLYIAFRQKILPRLSVRRAVAEDNDDLVSILDATAPVLKRDYGPYYISEIILNTTSNRAIIVAESDTNEAVGMLCLNTDIWMERLNHLFDVHAYQGFRKCEETKCHSLRTSTYSMKSQTEKLLDEDTTKDIRDRILREVQDVPTPDSTYCTESTDNDLDSSKETDDYILLLKTTLNKRLSSYDSFDDMIHNFSRDLVFNRSNDLCRFDQSDSMDKQTTPENKIQYKGENDAFLLELHGMRQDMDERLAISLLEAAFQTFPNLTYCLLSIPSTKRFFPLLTYFVKVVPLCVMHIAQTPILYTVQRNALFSNIKVRLGTPDDEKRIHIFLADIMQAEAHTADVMIAMEMNHKQRVYPYVIMAEDLVIGICILLDYGHLMELRHNYDIDSYMVARCHTQVCVLKMMILQPVFMVRLPFILSELFRQSGFTSMFYMLRDTEIESPMCANTMMAEMIPVRPRMRMHYQLDKLQPNQWPPRHVLHSHCHPLGLYYQNVNTCTKRKMPINERIVCIGCSTTALAFLEGLIFREECKDMYFTSITLISPNGLATSVFTDLSAEAKEFDFKDAYTPDYVKRLHLRTWVNVIHGSISRINREAKLVYIGNETVQYDRLFLFCGLQFDYPIKLKAPAVKPKNVQFINNAFDAELMLIKIQSIVKSYKQYHIIVYGENLYCYTCLNALINARVDPRRITFLRPRSTETTVGTTTLFNDKFVDDLMDKVLLESGIRVLDNYDIVEWKIEKDNVTKIVVESDLMVLELYCTMFVCFERKIVTRSTIMVLDRASLVFDGRIVIDENCKTNDPYIYAAGPMTKYKHNLYAENWRHELFASQEVGARLARKILDELNPSRSFDRKEQTFTIPQTVHQFKVCKVHCHAVLGGYHFVMIRLPGRPLPYDIAKSQADYGVDYVTGDNYVDKAHLNYCRVHMDSFHRVATIVSLTTKPLNVYKYISIWGIPDTLLNNLRLRYEAKMISDLHEHFTSPHMYLLYHDRYKTTLRRENAMVFLKTYEPEPNIIDEISDEIVKNKWCNLTEKQRVVIVEHYFTSPYEGRHRSNLLDFIGEHIDELSMFYNPNHIQIQK